MLEHDRICAYMTQWGNTLLNTSVTARVRSCTSRPTDTSRLWVEVVNSGVSVINITEQYVKPVGLKAPRVDHRPSVKSPGL